MAARRLHAVGFGRCAIFCEEVVMSTDYLRDLDYRDAPQKCEWQMCEDFAAFIRETPWGDLPVCRTHARTPLFENEDET